mmetsp:Transcript_75582/g.208514  ORF Transcript_75582/g.208514 Transcript_75582/m.208514 type:complete len:156 (-) Transcript_75582:27-494(-)
MAGTSRSSTALQAFLALGSLLLGPMPAAAGRLMAADASGQGVQQPHPPPDPVGAMPVKDDDGAYKTKDDACAACKHVATGSCAMYKACTCYAANAYFATPGLPEPSDKSNWKWACGAEGGDKYQLCFKVTWSEANAVYQDSFGDPVDPNNPKCPV